MLLCYARVSANDQAARRQLDAPTAAGCQRTLCEAASGATTDRPVLAEPVSHVNLGDNVVAPEVVKRPDADCATIGSIITSGETDRRGAAEAIP